MKYNDLIGVPFKRGGRSKAGMDCFGIVAECCRRAGKPINDPFAELDASIPLEEALAIRRRAINAVEADAPAVGRIAVTEHGGMSHVGYIVARGRVLHAVEGGGARVSPLACFRSPRFFEVT